jgi:hypothetical protein
MSMESLIKYTVFMLILAVLLTGCNKAIDNNHESEELMSLEGTKWKLEGIVDTATNTLQVLEPKDCDDCYTLVFDSDSTFITNSASNKSLSANCQIDYDTYSIHISSFGGNKMGEIGDGYIYVTPFWNKTIKSFYFQDNKLRLYYNDQKKYLLFNRIKL